MCAPQAEAALSQRLWVLRRYPVLELGKRRQQSSLTTGTSPTALSPCAEWPSPGRWVPGSAAPDRAVRGSYTHNLSLARCSL